MTGDKQQEDNKQSQENKQLCLLNKNMFYFGRDYDAYIND